MSAVSLTYEDINRNAQTYPAFLLPERGTGLCLFAAGFLGWNDAIHMYRSEMTVTCVDSDSDKLLEMATIYPTGEWVVDDAWEYATNAAKKDRQWDAVSVDPFMGNSADRAWETLGLWMMLPKKLLTLTVQLTGDLQEDARRAIPGDWNVSVIPRNECVGWLVASRD